MLKAIFVLAVGGAIGTILRYLMGVFFSRHYSTTFPLSTLLINVIGCFVVGLLYAASVKYSWFTGEWRLFLITGFCGAFTTFSAFALENVRLLQSGHVTAFIAYSLLSYGFGLLAVIGGAMIINLR